MNSASFFTQPDFRVAKLAGLDYACSCGRRHRVPIAHIALGQGALEKIPGIVRGFSGRNVFLIGDSHTYPCARAARKRGLQGVNLCFLPP